MSTTLTLKIPKRTSDNFGEPIDFFLNFLKQANKSLSNEVEFDFSKTKFISPFLVGGLAYLASVNSDNEVINKVVLNNKNAFFNAYREEVITLPNAYRLKGCFIALRVPVFKNESFNPYNYME